MPHSETLGRVVICPALVFYRLAASDGHHAVQR